MIYLLFTDCYKQLQIQNGRDKNPSQKHKTQSFIRK